MKKKEHVQTEGSTRYKNEREKNILETSGHLLLIAKAPGEHPPSLHPPQYPLTLSDDGKLGEEVCHENCLLVSYPASDGSSNVA